MTLPMQKPKPQFQKLISNTGDNRKISQNNQNSRVLMAPAEANRLIVPLGAIAESWVFSTQPPSKFTNHHL